MKVEAAADRMAKHCYPGYPVCSARLASQLSFGSLKVALLEVAEFANFVFLKIADEWIC